VGNIWGVGAAMQASLEKRGITMISQLQTMEKNELMRNFGSMGARLYHLSRGEDFREVDTEDVEKSISAETTFNEDIADYEALEAKLWSLCQKVSRRAKKQGYAGRTITLKLKTKDFSSRTRALSVEEPTNLAHVMFDAGKKLLRKETGREQFRLIGIGISRLDETDGAPIAELDLHRLQLSKAEAAIDKIREKFGNTAVDRGIGLKDKD